MRSICTVTITIPPIAILLLLTGHGVGHAQALLCPPDTSGALVNASITISTQDRSGFKHCADGHRLIGRGLTRTDLVSLAFDTPESRVLDQTNRAKIRYSIDLRVPENQEERLNPVLQRLVESGLGLEVRHETVRTTAGILRQDTKSEPEQFFSKFWALADSAEGQSSTTGSLARALSKALDMPVVDAADLTSKSDLSITWKTDGGVASYQERLSSYGLELITEKRPVEMLLIKSDRKPER